MSSQGRLSYDELLASLEELLQELKVPQKRSTMMAEEIADLLHDMGVSLDGYVAPEDVAEDEKEEKTVKTRMSSAGKTTRKKTTTRKTTNN